MKKQFKLYVDPMDVKTYDSESALILAVIDYWCDRNIKNDKKEIDGNHWSGYLTTNDISEQTGLPYKTVQRRLLRMKKEGIILVGNFGKVTFDKRRWYRRNEVMDNLSSPVDNLTSPVDNLGDTITNNSYNNPNNAFNEINSGYITGATKNMLYPNLNDNTVWQQLITSQNEFNSKNMLKWIKSNASKQMPKDPSQTKTYLECEQILELHPELFIEI